MPDPRQEADRELEEVLSSHRTRISIVGTGGAGNNTVTRLLEVGIRGVQVIAINTDAQDLLFAKADRKILIGKNITNGLGAGSDPKRGEESARENIKEIESALANSDMVFVTCGLGGGTGTGSGPIIADVAKKSGALTIAIVTLPFGDEGIVRWQNARHGLSQLQEKVDTVIVVQNDRLLDLVPDMPLNQAFKVADEILVNAVKGITELVTEKGLVNLDFADVRTIMQSGGLAMIGIGESETNDQAEEAAKKALENPLLDVDITGARSALINISGGKDMSLKSAKTIMKVIANRLDPSARIIWGARLDEAMGQTIRVMLIATCLKSSRRPATDIEMVLKESQNEESHTHEAEVAVATVETSEQENPEIHKKKGGQKVFSEIFMEESEPDINAFEEAAMQLEAGQRSENEKHLRRIQNACTSLYNSAELFGFEKISEFTDQVREVTERGLKAEFDFSESLVEIYQTVPPVLGGMINGEPAAFEAADEFQGKFMKILGLLQSNRNQNKKKQSQENGTEEETRVDLTADESKQKKANSKKSGGNGNPSFSNVKEAVKFIDKLF